MRLPIWPLLPMVLAACQDEPPALPSFGGKTAQDCGAIALAGLVGQHRSVLSQINLPALTRVIAPNSPVTMDYSPQRLNIKVNDQGIITRLHCG